MNVLACADKFRSTLSAPQFSAAVAAGLAKETQRQRGWDVCSQPMADGGEGTLAAFGGANRRTRVTGPRGRPVEAPWRYSAGLAVIEMALASGLELAGGASGNEPMSATTAGTGELIGHALDAGADTIVVGLGGSATTDGGQGALDALQRFGSRSRLSSVDLQVLCDVQTPFVEAAAVFGPQKGASPAEIRQLTRRLALLATVYAEEYGVEVAAMPGTGAAGGLAGGLVAIGGRIVPGASAIAEVVGLRAQMERADLVITGEGRVDRTSFDGKVVGTVIERSEIGRAHV